MSPNLSAAQRGAALLALAMATLALPATLAPPSHATPPPLTSTDAGERPAPSPATTGSEASRAASSRGLKQPSPTGPSARTGKRPPGISRNLTGARPGAPGARAAAPEPGLRIDITSINPPVAEPGVPVTITGSLSNDADTPAQLPDIAVRAAPAGTTTRAKVAAWTSATDKLTTAPLASSPVNTLAAHSGIPFTLSFPLPSAPPRGNPYGVIPLSIEAGAATIHTFIGYHQRKEYQPLAMAWMVPVTADADPMLYVNDPDPAVDRDRIGAWRSATSPTSRLVKLVESTENQPVTWALDPELLAPPAPRTVVKPTTSPTPSSESNTTSPGATSSAPTPTSSPTSTTNPSTPVTPAVPTAGPARPADEVDVRQTFARRLLTAASRHDSILLPRADADLAASTANPTAASLAPQLIADAANLSRTTGIRADLAWTADGTPSRPGQERLKAMFGNHPLTAAIAPDPGNEEPHSAPHRAPAGLPTIGYDTNLSRLFNDSLAASGGALASQHFIADTAALLQESPGIRRSVLATASRSVAADPAATSTFFKTITQVPWLTATTMPDLVTTATRLPGDGTPDLSPPSQTEPDSPLAGQGGSDLTGLAQQLARAASIRIDRTQTTERWNETLAQLTSLRWRGQTEAWQALAFDAKTEMDATTNAVHVLPQSINFFADRGRLQLTIVNDSPFAVDNIHVTLTPSSSRLRIEQPQDLIRISAHSRAAITVTARALAKGQVNIDVAVKGPNNAPIGHNSVLAVTVAPTGGVVYWGLGGLALIVLLLGWVRGRRRRKRTPRGAIILDENGNLIDTSAEPDVQPSADTDPPDAIPRPAATDSTPATCDSDESAPTATPSEPSAQPMPTAGPSPAQAPEAGPATSPESGIESPEELARRRTAYAERDRDTDETALPAVRFAPQRRKKTSVKTPATASKTSGTALKTGSDQPKRDD